MKRVKNFPTFKIIFDRRHISTTRNAAKPIAGLIQLKVTYQLKYTYIAIDYVYKDEIGKWVKGVRYGDNIHDRIDAADIERKLNDEKQRILADFADCERARIPWSIERIKTHAHRNNGREFVEYCNEFVKKLNVKDSTRQSYLSYIKRLDQYGYMCTFADVTIKEVMKFDEWLHSQISIKSKPSPKPCHRIDGKKETVLTDAAIHNIHSIVHKVIKSAMLKDLIISDPYDKFKLHKPKSGTRVFLTHKEVEAIRTWHRPADCNKLKNPEVTRDLFLLQCYTGLAFIDLFTADWASARTSHILNAPRHKTGVDYIVRLSNRVIEILDRYDWVMPHIQQVCYNQHIRYIVKTLGITKYITSHCGRHTFATTYGLNAGVPVEILAKMLGHSDIKTTQIYAKMLPDTVLNAFDMVDNAINKK